MPQPGAPKTRILISNDDGIYAPGLQTLTRVLHESGAYDIRVGAPETERSGSSHALSSRVTATLFENGADVGLPPAVVAYAASGFPTDAVRLAFTSDIFDGSWVPEVVVSGINRGINAGRALVVSGTLAAAREGAFLGAKSMAVSLHSFSSRMQEPADYESPVRDLMPILRWFVGEEKWPSSVMLNVNLPYEHNYGVIPRSLMVAPQGRSCYQHVAISKDSEPSSVPDSKGRTMTYKFRWSTNMDPLGTPENDDFVAAINNYVTLTPVAMSPSYDVTAAMDLLLGWRESLKHPTLGWALPN